RLQQAAADGQHRGHGRQQQVGQQAWRGHDQPGSAEASEQLLQDGEDEINGEQLERQAVAVRGQRRRQAGRAQPAFGSFSQDLQVVFDEEQQKGQAQQQAVRLQRIENNRGIRFQKIG